MIPSYDSGETEDKKSDKKDEVINADDPANREKVQRILYGT